VLVLGEEMSRLRLSDLLSRSGFRQRDDSKLYRRFKPYFEHLIDRGNQHFSTQNLADWYVPNARHAEKLVEILNDESGRHVFLTGVRGIGKSTLMRWILTPSSNPHLLREETSIASANAKLTGVSLVIPFDLGGRLSTSISSLEKDMSGQLLAANSLLQRGLATANGDRSEDYKIDRKELGEFIRNHNERLLYSVLPDPSKRYEVDLIEQISLLAANRPYAYCAEELKYLIDKSPNITRVILFIDNIEPLSLELQKAIIKAGISFYNCFRNADPSRQERVKLSLVFSLRPATFELLRRDPELDTFATLADAVYISNPPDIVAIFQKRFECVVQQLGAGLRTSMERVKDIDEWKRAYDVLNRIQTRVHAASASTLVKLCNLDLRLGAKKLAQVLEASHWMEQSAGVEDQDPGAFKIDDDNYRVTEAGFLRALVLGKFDTFRPPSPGMSDEVACNLFANAQDGRNDLMIAYIAKFFVREAVERKRHSDDGQMVVVRILGEDIYRSMQRLYGHEVFQELGPSALSSMITWGLIRIEGGTPGQRVDVNSYRSLDYIGQSRMYELFALLERSSVYLEMCRDDTHLERVVLAPRETTGTHYLNNSTAFLSREDSIHAVIAFAKFIHRSEQELIARCLKEESGRASSVRQEFGHTLLSKRVLTGILGSHQHYFRFAARASESLGLDLERLTAEINADQAKYESAE
jgi:hypothetical protein